MAARLAPLSLSQDYPDNRWLKSTALLPSSKSKKGEPMRLSSKWNRRSFLGSLGVIAGAIAAPLKLSAAKTAPNITGFGSSGNPYDELGVKTVINCVGTMT